MNLYLVERTDDVDWDEYSAMIVAAPTEEAACAILPCEAGWTGNLLSRGGVEKVTLEATLLGTTDYPEGEVLYTDYLYG